MALGPGANWEPKIWPATAFRQLIGVLSSQFDGVILLGGPGDAERCATVAQDSPLPCLNLAGETGLLEAAALLARAQLFVGNDSGLGHLASAVGTPTLTLFGPGQPERYRPWGEQAHWLCSEANELPRLDVATVAASIAAITASHPPPAAPARSPA